MTYLELKKKCEDRIKLIEDTKDDGIFAKHYVNDVKELLALIEAYRHSPIVK